MNQQLKPEQFDTLVENWNSLPDRKRVGRIRHCRESNNHYWVPTPYNEQGEFTTQEVCIFCLSYRCHKTEGIAAGYAKYPTLAMLDHTG